MAGLFVLEQPGPPGGPRVVLIHGTLDRSGAFVRVVRQLPDTAVTRYDRRGYARSHRLDPSGPLLQQIGDLHDVVAGRPSVLFGHSFGGVVALAFAARYPELARAVVAYESPMAWEPWWPRATAGAAALAEGPTAGDAEAAGDAAERFMRRMIGDARWDALPEKTRQQRRAEGPALVAELRSIRPPAPAPYQPSALPMPVIAAHGSRSRPHHMETARTLAAAAPRGELVVVDGASHGVHLSHPAAVADLVRLALRRADG